MTTGIEERRASVAARRHVRAKDTRVLDIPTAYSVFQRIG